MPTSTAPIIRRRFTVSGQVQGVGFRPFVYRTALARGLVGEVRNTPQGVVVAVQGPEASVDAFAHDLEHRLPPLARITALNVEDAPIVDGEAEFCIAGSEAGEGHTVLISPDTATCADCLADMAEPGGRRKDYPFTNCTNCGPRYTITRSIPYDRPVTSMACFPMCPDCKAEYHDPLDRRFHAQPNACPVCGPRVWLVEGGEARAEGDATLTLLAQRLAQGAVAAVKGLGGYHLACDALDADAVAALRERKARPHKPLAVMLPDLDAARKLAHVSEAEAEWLTGAKRPIVLCRAREGGTLPESIAPDTDFVGVMLPYTPLHHVLLARFAAAAPGRVPALVMTSGNLGGDPICLGNREALARLADIADLFLFHDRDILIRCDDSVLRVVPDTAAAMPIRRARGFTPEPIDLPAAEGDAPCVLGLGPELKNTLTLTKGDQAFPSQHIGDMENLSTLAFHKEILAHLQDILRVTPKLVVHDLHPDYMTTALAQELAANTGVETAALQHHYAHAHAVLAEHRHERPALCLALDGTGYGEDGTIWGGECLWVDPAALIHRRLAHFSLLPLPGGEAAVREPWRIAQGALWRMGITDLEHGPGNAPWPWLADNEAAARFLPSMLAKGVNCPVTSSCGRLFDAVSALLGLCQVISYEGQAAILLERAQDMDARGVYECPVLDPAKDGDPMVLDTLALLHHACDDALDGTPAAVVARRFHRSLVRALADLALTQAEATGTPEVALSGGVMQNMTMAVELPRALVERGLVPLAHTAVPPNDACVSLGQAAWGRRLLLNRR